MTDATMLGRLELNELLGTTWLISWRAKKPNSWLATVILSQFNLKIVELVMERTKRSPFIPV